MKTVEELINEAREQESKEVARLTALTQIKGAESRAAEVIADQALRGRFRYCPAIGWLEWVGTHWDDDATASLRAGEVIRRHVDELERDYRAKAIAGEPARAALLAEVVARVPEDKRVNRNHRALKPQELFNEHATDDERSRMVDLRIAVDQADMWHNFLQKKHIAALVAICMGMDGILTRFEEWDTNLDFFNCTNGTVDLRTKTLLEHNPDDLITKIAGGPYIEGFRLDLWDRALEAVYPDIRRWFRIRMGQSISGHITDDDVTICSWGGGENGKTSVFTGVLRACKEYGRLIDHKILLATPGQHTTELMDLRGLRFALMEETPEEGRLDTHKLKTTVGSTYITGRKMRRDTITFKTSHTLWINTNFRPMVDTTDHATWRRLKAMVWPYRFITLQPGESLPPQEPGGPLFKVGDPTIRPAIEEHPDIPAAVIAYLVEGAYEWYQNNRIAPTDPPEIAKATSEWREASDASYRFAKCYLTAAPGMFITGQVMKDALIQCLAEDGKAPWSSQLITSRLRPAMLAAGIAVDRDPTTSTTIKKENVQSLPDFIDPFTRASWKPVGTSARVWRGVRFKTEDERRVELGDDDEAPATAPESAA